MGDFLSNLAARSLGVAEVVQPQIASLFEPPPAAVLPRAPMLEVPSLIEQEDVEGDARPAAATPDVTHAVERPSAPFSRGHEGRERETIHAIAPAASEPPERPTGDGAEGRPPEFAVRPAMRAHPPSRVSQPATTRTSDVSTIRRSGESSPEAHLALVRDGAGDRENPSSRAASEARRPVDGHVGPPRDLGRADGSGRPGVSLAVEADGEPGASEAAASPAARRENVLLALPPSMARASEADAVRRSGLSAPTTRPAPVRDETSGGRIAPSATRPEPVRSLRADLRASFESGPSDPSRGDPLAPRDAGTAGPAKVVVQPRVALYWEPVALARPRPGVRAEPTIQVTIGRVEVRATPPAAAVTPRERQTPTAMSLDEYLRHRAGGSPR